MDVISEDERTTTPQPKEQPNPQPPPSCPFSPSPSASCPFPFTLPPTKNPDMQEIDPTLLRESLPARVAYLKDFLGFGRAQEDILHKVAPLVNDLIVPVVDGLYAKLFEFDVTKEIFMERNEGFDGELPRTLEELTLDSPQLVYRKIFMRTWARRILTASYTPATFAYMDKVGRMHTGSKAFRRVEGLVVPYRDCALTLGWVQNVLQTAILQLDESVLPVSEKIEALGAVCKVIWIQNDLFARHYIDE